MNLFMVAGDVLWILALSIMASATRLAWLRMTPDTLVPMSFTQDGRPGLRLKRFPGLIILPGFGFVVGALLVTFNRNIPAASTETIILFGVRATAAALVAFAHLRWLKAAIEALENEGALKDPQ